MTILVPFDGSAIASAGLRRGSELAAALDRDLLVYAVVPDHRHYAVQKDWIEKGADLDVETVIGALQAQVEATAPEATFEYQVIEGSPSGGYIARKIRDFARQREVRLLVLGSETLGRVVTPLTSVSQGIAAEQTYELYLVQDPDLVDAHPLRRDQG